MTETHNSQFLEKLPGKLADQLMLFQKDGIKYALEKNGRCLIADEMGLGKTIQALSVAYIYQSEWPLLIIVPSSLRFCWVEEIEKWFPDTNPEDIFMVQTGNDASGIQRAKIVIATYGLLSKASSRVVLQALTNQNFQVVIVDESHYIRNIKTASCKAVGPLIRAANRRILLSGTPSLSKPVELYSQIDAICPNKFGSWWTYTAHFCDAKIQHIGKIRKRNVDGASNLGELQKKLRDILMIRRMKDDVLTQLPAKQRQQILFQLKDSQVSKDIQKTFQELKSSMRRDRCQVDSVLQTVSNDGCSSNTLSLIQKLYQLSGEAKIGPAREYVAMLCDNKNLKFLVFAYHRSMMNGLQQTLMEHDVKFVRIDGDTKPSERQLYVQQFQSDPDTRVAILSILAAGVGLTFTKATLVVFAEMYWTPGVLIQCEDRAHRIGQTQCVSIHYLVAKDTMDEWVWSAICRKTIVTTTTLNGQKQVLTADKGDKYQVDLLSTADVYKAPTAEEAANTDFAAIFSSQQPKDQTSILDFLSSGKKRKREDNSSTKKRKRSSTSENTEEIVEISDGETSDTGNVSLSVEKESKSHPMGNSEKKTYNSVDKSKRLFFSQRSSSKEDSDEFVFAKTKKTRTPLQSKQPETSQEPWGCSGCTFINHADLPFCEICNTPKHKKSKSFISSQDARKENQRDFLNSLNKENKLECQGVNKDVKRDDSFCDNEVMSESQSSCSTESTGKSCLNSNEPREKTCIMGCEPFDNNQDNDEVSDKCSGDESFSVKSKKARRRTFFLETYSPSSKSSVDENYHLSQNSVGSDQISSDSYTGSTGKGNLIDEVEAGNEDVRNMDDSREEERGGDETVEEDVSFVEHSTPSTQNDVNHDIPEDTKDDDAVDEMFTDEWEDEASSPNEDTEKNEDTTIVKDISNVPVFKSFQYKCSAYTSRIYLYNESGNPLRANFVPLDIELNNQGNLPDLLLHPHNLRLVQKFLREWHSLTETKRRLIVKSSQLFDSPLVAYEALKSGGSVTTIRHKTKEHIAAESLAKASQIQGGVRVVKRSQQSEANLIQATTAAGVPICLNCSEPCDIGLVNEETLKDSQSAWATRFCSQKCMDKYWIQTSSSYCRDQVYEAEHGVCQLCQFDAHALYKQIRDTKDLQKRVDILHSSQFDKLNPKQKEVIVRNPVAGQFWHVDHIRPVWEGGGQCDIDNFRTLCVLCHHKVTAGQAKKRATVRKLGVATGMADITAFFQPA